MGHKTTPAFGLPAGATVGASVRIDDPASLARTGFRVCTVLAYNSSGTSIMVRANGEDFGAMYKPLSDLYVATLRRDGVAGKRWKRADQAAKHPNARGLWWWDHNGAPCRVASTLEVALYSDGFVPASGWRLATPENEELQLPKPEVVWRTPNDFCSVEKPKPEKPKPVYKTADEKKLARARAMLAKATTRVKRATTIEKKWAKTVRRLERKAAT
jgi:hypothetical protein